MSVKYRPGKLSDVEQVVALLFKFLDFAQIRYNPQRVVNIVIWLLDGQGHLLQVAEDNGRIVGMIAGSLDEEYWFGNWIVIDRFVWVEPEYRNKEVSHHLLKDLETWAKSKGATRIWFHIAASKDNDSLANVLEWLGYKRKGYVLFRDI